MPLEQEPQMVATHFISTGQVINQELFHTTKEGLVYANNIELDVVDSVILGDNSDENPLYASQNGQNNSQVFNREFYCPKNNSSSCRI